MAVKYAELDTWQVLHAVWLGLSAKIEDGTIDAGRAIDLFERERRRAIAAERRREREKREQEFEDAIEPPVFGSTG